MLFALALAAALAPIPAPAAVESNAFLHDFAGSWSCSAPEQTASEWRIAAVPGSLWARVDWGLDASGVAAGTAFVGYIEQQQRWVYRDFHGDGSYANIHGYRAADGTWTWSGPYFRADAKPGTAPLDGVITWKRVDATHVARTYAQRIGARVTPEGSDICTLR